MEKWKSTTGIEFESLYNYPETLNTIYALLNSLNYLVKVNEIVAEKNILSIYQTDMNKKVTIIIHNLLK